MFSCLLQLSRMISSQMQDEAMLFRAFIRLWAWWQANRLPNVWHLIFAIKVPLLISLNCFGSCFADAQPWSKMRWNPTLRFQRDSALGKISRYNSDFIALCRNVNLAPWEICRTVKKAVLVLSDLIILADTRAVKGEDWTKKPSHVRKLSFR